MARKGRGSQSRRDGKPREKRRHQLVARTVGETKARKKVFKGIIG